MASDRRRPPLTDTATSVKPSSKAAHTAPAALNVARPKTTAPAQAAKAAPQKAAVPKAAATTAAPAKAAAVKPAAVKAVPQSKTTAKPAATKSAAPKAEAQATKPVAEKKATQAKVASAATETAASSVAPKAPTGKVAIPRSSAVRTAAAAEKPPRVLPPGSYILDDQIGFQLRRAHQRATTIFHDVMTRFDVTPTQFAALAKIDDEGPISQNHLGRLTAMDPSTILGVVGRLQRQGLIHLRSTPGDARLTMIELTSDGKTKVAEMKIAALDVTKQTLAPLTADEAKALTDLLTRIG